jgi:hypothetical protein
MFSILDKVDGKQLARIATVGQANAGQDQRQ